MMDAAESKMKAFLRSRIRGTRPVGVLACAAGDRDSDFSGRIEAGLLSRKKHDAVLLLRGPQGSRPDFSDLLHELRNASRSHPQGPWYRCNIHIEGREIRFQYFWENAPFTSVKELELDYKGSVPNFVLARRFDRALVEELTDFDVGSCLFLYIPARIMAGKPITDALLEVYATLEWQRDVNNGAMNQYFARDHDPISGQPRSLLYGKTYQGLLRIGHEAAAKVFAESIALYAHFYPRVETARQQLNIPAVTRQEQSDIMAKFHDLESTLDGARVKYIREHIGELEQS